MKQSIIDNISNPENLEKLYRSDMEDFQKSFTEISDDYNTELVNFWKIRLSSESSLNAKSFLKSDLIAVIALALFSGFLAKLPAIFTNIDTESFFTRNLAIIVFNGIILFTFWQFKIFDKKKLLLYCLTILILTFYINSIPDNKSDSSMLALIHSPLFLWCLFGFSYISFDHKNSGKLIEFIRFNGELLIMNGLIVIAGGMLTMLSIGLFSAIKMNIEKFYINYVVIIGGVASPLVSYYLIKLYPDLTNKIAPVIAKVFTPLVLLSLTVYLISLIFSGMPVLENRDLLIVFNVLLVAVMAIIVFSILALQKTGGRSLNVLFLFCIALLTIVINSVALIAIISRLLNGLTPNRTVVLISNILIFVHLILLARSLYRSGFKSNQLDSAEAVIAKYLPVYASWTIIVIFILPFIFGFR